jgi:colicin import membrane protein
MKNAVNSSLSRYLFVSVLLHLLLLLIFFFNVPQSNINAGTTKEIQPPLIHASIVTESTVAHHQDRLVQQAKRDKQEEVIPQANSASTVPLPPTPDEIKQQQEMKQQALEAKKIAEQKDIAAKQKALQEKAEEKKAEQEQAQKEKAEQETVAKQQAAAKAEALAKKRATEKAEDAKKAAEVKQLAEKKAAAAKLAAEKKATAAKKLAAEKKAKALATARAKQAANERQAKATADAGAERVAKQESVRIQGEVADYQQMIKDAVEHNWDTEGLDISQNLSCQISIRLMPDGSVLRVKILRSSGNNVYDQSVIDAVNHAAPLPVPSDPKVFTEIREITMTLNGRSRG